MGQSKSLSKALQQVIATGNLPSDIPFGGPVLNAPLNYLLSSGSTLSNESSQ